ncbi:DEAD/DEAH box helicase [Anaeromyxobacter oryzae]|uniref:Helicase n=1 Tax=Anaeromyxobacter oryzae TaxID=2918170 RepID=A0ABM7WZ80_9BACT|nr:DEAD/DEAH box helicase [Anaeromyxobacter oryzae]BDG04844.1 helicase [Anaeromyxobacter oryzae]
MTTLTPIAGEAPLAALLPPRGEALAPDAVLDRFVSWVAGTGLTLYPHQEEAILHLLDGKHVVLSTPTGSGKSLVATFLHFQAMAAGQRSFYTCPIKALVNEKFFDLCRVFGPENVGMMTGDGAVNRDAPIVCCTAEILMNLAVRGDAPRIDAVVMDEFHYYGDRDRGVAWQVPLLVLEDTRFLLMSATLGDTKAIEASLQEVTGRAIEAVRNAARPVPLEFEYRETPLHETIEELVSANKAPIYLVNFTQRAAAEQAQNLMSANFSSKEEKARITEALADARFDSPYGKELQRFVRHGIGLHHAGLLPRYRLLVEKLAQGGLLKVVSGTDTLGMGVNIPIRTVLFTQLCKFDGTKTAILSSRDFHQISGRAGRKGFDEKGYVVAQAPEHVIENKKLAEKAAAGKKVVKKQPPTKGYVHFDRNTFEKLREKEPEPLESRFEVTFGLLVNLLQSETARVGGGYGRLVELIGRSHGNDYVRAKHRRTAAQRLRTLRGAGLVELKRIEGYRGAYLRPAPGLQRDFSLFHTLSLYLLDTLPKIPRERETYALDVLSMVESILEDPDVILWKQLDQARGRAVAEMKAQGMEYDERMAELEKVEYPKPNRDFVYATFNEFAAKHPWVGAENIRPKSVARQMVERFMTFADYVREYELQRSEGLVLRYLSEAYKTLVQTVPETYRDDALLDVIAFLRATVRGVDSSLIDEWERMRDPAYQAQAVDARAAVAATLGPPPIWADPRAFAARLRNELHAVLVALARKDHAAAVAALAPGSDWTPARLDEAMAPYWAEHPRIDTTPAARRPDNTFVKELGPRRWEAVQRIVDEAGEVDWAITCEIDLSGTVDPDRPILSLVSVGT